MAIVLAVIGYGAFLYGLEASGLLILGLAIGVLWAEERRRVDNAFGRSDDGRAPHSTAKETTHMRPTNPTRRSV